MKALDDGDDDDGEKDDQKLNSKSTFRPPQANAQEPIPHVSWE
jgi:hypothetical protein